MLTPLLVMLTGLPGSGESTVAQALCSQLPKLDFAIVASDQVRKELFARPSYSDEENTVTHQTVQARILTHLRAGRSVIHDATNLRRQFRRWRHEAERLTGCRSVLLHVVLDEATTRQRLAARQDSDTGWSDADMAVYALLKDSAEPIHTPHLIIQTAASYAQDLAAVSTTLAARHGSSGQRQPKSKSFAYITRNQRLLVFRHPDAPTAGLQVPAGTVEAGETAQAAVLREALEETGLRDLRLASELGQQTRDMSDYGRNELHQRRFFHLHCTEAAPTRWQHWEQFGSDGEQHLFEFFWVDINAVPVLIADHDLFVEQLQARLLA